MYPPARMGRRRRQTSGASEYRHRASGRTLVAALMLQLVVLRGHAGVPPVDLSILRSIARLNPNMSSAWPVGTDPCDPGTPWKGVVCDEAGQNIITL